MSISSNTEPGGNVARAFAPTTFAGGGDIAVPLLQSRLILLADPKGRGQGVMVGIAALMTDENATVMAVHGRGLLAVTVDPETAFRLGLRRMASQRSDLPNAPEFLVSIEASRCEGTGISARDRALTIRCAGRPDSDNTDVICPGHIVPLLVKRPDRPNAQLPELAHVIVRDRCGFPVAAWCDVLNDQGDTASFAECCDIARRCDLPVFDVTSVFTGSSSNAI